MAEIVKKENGETITIEISKSNIPEDSYLELAEYLETVITASAGLMWCYASKSPLDHVGFLESTRIFDGYTANCFKIKNNEEKITRFHNDSQESDYIEIVHLEHILVNIYAKYKVGGVPTALQEEDRLIDWINLNYINPNDYSSEILLIPSFLAWLELYELEKTILELFVELEIGLDEKQQERLKILQSDSDMVIYDSSSDLTVFDFDSGSEGWNEEDFEEFFRVLKMKQSKLNYSLLIKKWTKTIPLSRDQQYLPENLEEKLFNLINDFDGEVELTLKKASAVNVVNLSYNNAFIFKFTSERNRCLTVLLSIDKFGRNINISVLTLFTPEDGLDNHDLYQYAIAIEHNIFVDSFKEAILQVVDESVVSTSQVYDESELNLFN